MKNILVTGAGGFIGYHLCNYLADKAYNVTGVDIRFPGDLSNLSAWPFRPLLCDFRDIDKMKKVLKGVDIVFHLASAHLQISLSESEYWDINVHSLQPFLKRAMENGVGLFIHVSSVGVYGDLKKWPADEESLCKPQSIYGETKIAGELVAKKFSRETAFPVVIIRPAWVYGTGCPRTLKLFKTIQKRRFVMIGKGNNLRHPVYIKDMLDAFHLVTLKKDAVGELFVIGGEQAITTRELVNSFCNVFNLPKPKIHMPFWLGSLIASLAECLFGMLKKEPPISKRTLEFFDTNNAFDISKAKNVLGFRPKFSFEEGLKDCQDWLINQGSLGPVQ